MVYWSFWGMNFVWWIFWVVAIVAFFVALTPVPRGRARLYDDPRSILQRRYARGEINTAEYAERLAVLNQQASDQSQREPSGPATTTHAHSNA